MQSAEPVAEAAGSADRWAQRFLSVVGVPARAEASALRKGFEHFLLLYLASSAWLAMLVHDFATVPLGMGVLYTLLAAAFTQRPEQWIFRVAIAASLFETAWLFPENANHQVLGLFCLALVNVAGRDGTDSDAVLVLGFRWTCVIVFLWSGLQKVLYGTYFNGSFLGTRMIHEGFALVMRPLIGDAEVSRLAQMDPATSDGPYTLPSLLAVAASNAVWLGELTVAALLLGSRMRRAGVWLGVAVIAGIEFTAREVFFGLFAFNLLLFFGDVKWTPRLRIGAAASCCVLVALQAWLNPVRLFN